MRILFRVIKSPGVSCIVGNSFYSATYESPRQALKLRLSRRSRIGRAMINREHYLIVS